MPDSVYRPLYNGNISSMATYIRRFEGAEPALLTAYKYDQLNRLTRQDVYKSFNATTNSYSGLQHSNMFRERVSYDANGNILTYRRNANGEYENLMDDLTYHYYPGSNQLKRVDDTIDSTKYGANSWDIILDIDDQLGDTNYVYDAIGNLIQDKRERITNIKWNVYGKIMEITRNATAGDKVPATRIRYTYDAQGNRISQVVEKAGSSTKDFTWYVRDAQGNMITTYKANGNVDTTTLNNLVVSKNEHMIYGSSRLGSHPYDFSVDGGPTTRQFYSAGIFERGWRQYELSNHLGNVLTTISDKKIGVSSGAIGTPIDYYDPEIVSATDYYPFGMVSRVATSSTGKDYRFGFNGKENDNGVKGFGNQQDYGMRIYDPRIGKFLSVDPLTKKYPWNSPYSFAENDVTRSIDLDGLEKFPMSGDKGANLTNIPLSLRAQNEINVESVRKADRANPTRISQTKEQEVKVYASIPHTKCHIDGDLVVAIENQRLADLYSKLDYEHGQIELPRNKFVDYIFGGRTLSDFENINGKMYASGSIINNEGYITNKIAPSAGIAPVDGAFKGVSAGSKLLSSLKTAGSGAQYSVAFEMKLASTSFPGVYRGAHFLEANKALSTAMVTDAKFAASMSGLGITIPKSPAGSILGKSPSGWVWHHNIEPGVMQLVPKAQHTIGSRFWNTLHPAGQGGFFIWGR